MNRLRDTVPFRALVSLSQRRGEDAAERCQALLELVSAVGCVRSCLRAELVEMELTELDLGILLTLFTTDPTPSTLAVIASHTGSTRPGMTEATDRLESRGLVRRERDTRDRRLVFVRLTNAGREAAESAIGRFIGRLDALASRIPAAGRDALLETCAQLHEATRPSASPS